MIRHREYYTHKKPIAGVLPLIGTAILGGVSPSLKAKKLQKSLSSTLFDFFPNSYKITIL